MNFSGPRLQVVAGLVHMAGSARIMPGWSTHISWPHLAHLKSALVILGRTGVTLFTMPSTETSLPRCFALSFLIPTLASWGIEVILTFTMLTGSHEGGMADSLMYSDAAAMQRSGASMTYIANCELYMSISS